MYTLKKIYAVQLVLCSCLLFFTGCKEKELINTENQNSQKDTGNMLTPGHVEKSEGCITISYSIANPFDYDIWVCEGINKKAQSDSIVKDETIYLRLFSSLPYNKEASYYFSPVAYYSRLPAHTTAEREIRLNLPFSPVSYFGESGRWRKQGRGQATKIVLQIGYFEPQAIKQLGKWAQLVSADEIHTQVIRDVCPKEQIIELVVADLKIRVKKE